jgi:PhnB protein
MRSHVEDLSRPPHERPEVPVSTQDVLTVSGYGTAWHYRCHNLGMASVQPELWVDRAGDAIEFYAKAFGAKVLHHVGDGDDIVAQLAIGDAAFWLASAGPENGRFSPKSIGGATSRTLLVVDDPATVSKRAVPRASAQGLARMVSPAKSQRASRSLGPGPNGAEGRHTAWRSLLVEVGLVS